MPETPEGEKSHLDYWLYGIVKTAESLGNVRLFLRAAQEVSIRKFLETEYAAFRGISDPIDILRAYNGRLDARGVLDASDIEYRRTRDGLEASVGKTCPYRTTCKWIHDERGAIPCFRAISMGEVLRIASHQSHEASLLAFGSPCRLSFVPSPREALEDGN